MINSTKNINLCIEPAATTAATTPPGSPGAMKRSLRDENVFQRLTSNTEIPVSNGIIKTVKNKVIIVSIITLVPGFTIKAAITSVTRYLFRISAGIFTFLALSKYPCCRRP
jgi:hypothetical protein